MINRYRRNRFNAFVSLISAILSCAPTLAHAQRIIRVPTDAATVQQAINEASAGDTVLIAPGIYHENIDFLGKAITVEGTGAPSATVLDGNGNTVVAFQNGEGRNSILEDVTIENGSPAILRAGGIYIHGASPTIQNDIVQNNIGCGIGAINGAPLISGNVISLTTEPGMGRNEVGPLPCIDPSGNPNLNTAYGTGIFIYGTSKDGLETEILGNTVTENDGSPAGIYLAESGLSVVENNVITGNTSRSNSGILADGDVDPLIIQNVIADNATDTALLVNPGFGAGAAGLALGADCTVNPGIPAIVADNTIANNSVANWPSGFLLPGTQVTLGTCKPNQIVLYNNIIVGVGSQPIVGCQSTNADGVNVAPPNFYYNDVFAFGSGSLYYEDCPDATGSNGNISADPLFAPNTPGEPYPYQLQQPSPAVDAGDNNAPDLPAKDILGHPRIQDAKGLPAAIVDMGAYEFAGRPVPGAPDFLMTVNPQTLMLNPGSSASASVLLNPNGYFNGEVALSCAGLPATLTCAFSSQRVSLTGGLPAGSTLTLRIDAQAAGSMARPFTTPKEGLALFWLCGLTGLALSALQLQPRGWTKRPLSVVSATLLALALSGCGVTFGAGGTYAIEVVAVGGSVSHQSGLTVTIPR